MTNKEKAKEIGVKYQTPCHGVGDCEFEARQSALEMAQWKDDQARESFCLALCKGRPPRSTCTSLGTCDDYNRFSKLMREGCDYDFR